MGEVVAKTGFRRQKLLANFWLTKVFHNVTKSLQSQPMGEKPRSSSHFRGMHEI
jgi:hypothetical protein